MCVKVIASQRWDVFLRHSVDVRPKALFTLTADTVTVYSNCLLCQKLTACLNNRRLFSRYDNCYQQNSNVCIVVNSVRIAGV